MDVSDRRRSYRDGIKQYEHSKDCGNQTFLVDVDFTSSSKCDPNQTAIDNNKDASKAKGETNKVSFQTSATNRSRKENIVAKSGWSRQREIEPMERENLIAKQKLRATAEILSKSNNE